MRIYTEGDEDMLLIQRIKPNVVNWLSSNGLKQLVLLGIWATTSVIMKMEKESDLEKDLEIKGHVYLRVRSYKYHWVI